MASSASRPAMTPAPESAASLAKAAGSGAVRALLAIALALAPSAATAAPDGGTAFAPRFSSSPLEVSPNALRVLTKLDLAAASGPLVPRLKTSAFPEIEASLRAARAVGRPAAEFGKIYLIVLTAFVVGSAYEAAVASGVDLDAASPAEKASFASRATSEVLDSSEIPLGILGFMASKGLVDWAMQKGLAEMYLRPGVIPKLARFLSGSAAGAIGVAGGAFMAQLADEVAWEASDRTGNKDDYERAKHPVAVWLGARRAKAGGPAVSDRDRADLRLLDEMLSALTYVVASGDGIREWFSNAWRLDVATGEFVATLAALGAGMRGGAMAAAGARAGLSAAGVSTSRVVLIFTEAGDLAIGASLGAATAASVVLFVEVIGVALSFVAVYSLLPASVKNRITREFRSARSWVDGARIGRTEIDLRAALTQRGWGITMSSKEAAIAALLAERRSSRDAIATVAFEKTHDAVRAWAASDASEGAGSEAIAIIAGERASVAAAMKADREGLERLVALADRVGADALAATLREDARDVARVAEFLDGALELSAEIPRLSKDDLKRPETARFVKQIELAYRRGFPALLKLWQDADRAAAQRNASTNAR